ncbi:uncharacterized protein DS421_10g294190 [Arachis hypogaea]|nr:uncharacterized protein DS421_10g294190 [Arachis hypogaea]
MFLSTELLDEIMPSICKFAREIMKMSRCDRYAGIWPFDVKLRVTTSIVVDEGDDCESLGENLGENEMPAHDDCWDESEDAYAWEIN